MKLSQAVNKLSWRLAPDEKGVFKQFLPNQNDKEAFNTILTYINKTQEETVQENLLFAKLYAFVLCGMIRKYDDIDFSNKQLNKVLSEPMSYRIEMLLTALKYSELDKCFKSVNVHGKSEQDLKEIFSVHKKVQENFLTCWEWWDKDNVISHLNTNINLSIHEYKNAL